MGYHKVIGIDLGTTYSTVSIYRTSDNPDEKGEVVVIKNPVDQQSTVPSVVGLNAERKVIVGTQAQNNLVMDPANTIIEIKRLMGTYEVEPVPGSPDEKLRAGTPKTVPFLGRMFKPQEISAFILMELKRMAEEFTGEPIHDAVITVPAYFKEPQKGATADAAAIARLNVKRLINEPTAAAVCFKHDLVKDEDTHVYAVYDLGGGTFDVSIVQMSGQDIAVVGTGGDPHLGGGDFDDRITGYALSKIKEQFGEDLTGNPAVWARVKREAEMRKRELSSSTSTTLNLPFLTATISANIPLSRATFEKLIEDLLQKTLTSLDDAIRSAEENSIERESIEEVLLVGGSSRIACIRSMLAAHLGMELDQIRADIDPAEAISRGATIVALEFNPSDAYEGEEITVDTSDAGVVDVTTDRKAVPLITDVTSHSLGIEVHDGSGIGRFQPIILKDSIIPADQVQDGFSNAGPTNEIVVNVYQGEDPIARANTLIGSFPIPLQEKREAGYYHFSVKFALDKDGLLTVVVNNLIENRSFETKIHCNVRISREESEAKARELAEMFAGRSGAPEEETGPITIPPPPRPKTAVPPPPSPETTQQGGAIPPVPPTVPEEYQSLVRRSFKLIAKLPPGSQEQRRLSAAYQDFLTAIENGDPDLVDYAEDLRELYTDFNKRC